MPPGTTPRAPTAAASEPSAEVVIVRMFPCCVWGKRRYLHYTQIIEIPFEELSAEREEVRVNNTIVLKNNTVLYILEKPFNSRRDGRINTHIVVMEPRFDITRPVNSYCCLSGKPTLLNVLRTAAARTIGSHKEPIWLDLTQILHDRSCLIRSIEDCQENRDLFIGDAAI